VRAEGLTGIGIVEWKTGHGEDAVALIHEVLDLSRAIGDEPSVADALSNIGYFGVIDGNYDDARAALSEGLALARQLGDDWRIVQLQGNLGLLHLFEQRWRAARDAFLEELRLSIRRSNLRCGLEALHGLAAACAAGGEPEAAVALGAAAASLAATSGIPTSPKIISLVEQLVAEARARLEPPSALRLAERGKRLTLEEALELVSS
jgi:hypothetical protein